MELGYFTMPSHPPERPLKDGHEWDLKVIRCSTNSATRSAG